MRTSASNKKVQKIMVYPMTDQEKIVFESNNPHVYGGNIKEEMLLFPKTLSHRRAEFADNFTLFNEPKVLKKSKY